MKLGIVFEGGASRSLFSCGVMDALLTENILADYVIGVSAGIAYGTSYVSKQIGRNLELSLKYMHDKRYMGLRHLLNPKNRSYYNRAFAFNRIAKELVLFDFDTFANSGTEAVATLTNIKTGKAEYMTLPCDDWEKHISIIWASCALPFLFQPEEIDGNLYLDGGCSDPIPYKKALEDGCDKLICVLTREKDYQKTADHSLPFIKRSFKKYPELVNVLANRSENYNQTRSEIFELAKTGKLFVIAPTSTVGFNRTERDPQKLQDMFDQGYSLTKKEMNKLREYLSV